MRNDVPDEIWLEQGDFFQAHEIARDAPVEKAGHPNPVLSAPIKLTSTKAGSDSSRPNTRHLNIAHCVLANA